MKSLESTEPVRSLLIESDAKDAKPIVELLSEVKFNEFDIAVVSTLEDAIKKVAQEKFDLVLLNLMLSDSGGIYTLTKLVTQVSEVPIVVINAPDDTELAKKALQSGAQDYFSKTSAGSSSFFLRCLRHVLWRFQSKHSVENEKSDDQYASKMVALGKMADSIAAEIQTPISDLKKLVTQLKTQDTPSGFAPEIRESLISSSERASHQLGNIFDDLKTYSTETDRDPIVQARKRKRSFRFLVVEDESEIAEIVVDLLKRIGHSHIETACDGEDAYKKCIATIANGPRYDAVISDWIMPKLNGLELLEKLRANPFFGKVAFMMLTALGEKANVEEALDRGVTQYLIKPFSPEELRKRVERLLFQIRS